MWEVFMSMCNLWFRYGKAQLILSITSCYPCFARILYKMYFTILHYDKIELLLSGLVLFKSTMTYIMMFTDFKINAVIFLKNFFVKQYS